jgi:hypothetical protein
MTPPQVELWEQSAKRVAAPTRSTGQLVPSTISGRWWSKNSWATRARRVLVPDFSKIALQVVLHGGRRHVQVGGDLARRQPARDLLGHRQLPIGEAVGLGDRRRPFLRTRRIDEHGDSVVDERAAHDRPVPGRAPVTGA